MRERTIFARQARHSARGKTDLCRCPFLAVVAVGHADTEGDILEAGQLREIVADMVDLLLALLSFDLGGGQRGQPGRWCAGHARQQASDKTRPQIPTHATAPRDPELLCMDRFAVQAEVVCRNTTTFQSFRSTIAFFSSAISFAGLRPFGQAFEQFRMV